VRLSLRNPLHTYKHLLRYTPYTITNNNLGAGLGSVFNLNFSMNNTNNIADFTALYDSYKVNKLFFKLIPWINSADISGLDSLINPGWLPMVLMVHDFDDGSAPTYTDLLQNNNLKVTKYGPIIKESFEPRYNSSLQNLPSNKSWLDMSTLTTVHYGIKGFISDANVGTATLYWVIVEAEVEFRGQQ